jgi:hypothetical protein
LRTIVSTGWSVVPMEEFKMRSPSFSSRRWIAAAVLFTMTALAPAVPVHAQSASNYDIDINYDTDPAGSYRPCPMTVSFSALITAKDPEPGMPEFPVTYHWERAGKRWKDHTFNVDATGQSDPITFHDLTAPFRGTLTFVITKPWHTSKTTADMDIICH